jgi:hypothetical protein
VGESGGNPDDDLQHGTATININALGAMRVGTFRWISNFQSPKSKEYCSQ